MRPLARISILVQEEDENKLSAYDVAIVARNLIRDYPQFWKSPITSTFGRKRNHSTNYMDACLSWWYWWTKDRVLLIKLVLRSLEQLLEKGMRIITVVLNADQQDANPYAAFYCYFCTFRLYLLKLCLKTVVWGEAYNDSKQFWDGR